MEPSSVLQLIALPVLLLDWILRYGLTLSLGGATNSLAQYLADAYADPRHAVILLRLIVGGLSSFCPFFVFWLLRSLGVGVRGALLAAVGVSMHPAFFGQSIMAAGDAVGLTAVIAAMAIIANTRLRFEVGASWAGLIHAFAVAAKLTMASSLLVLPAVYLAREKVSSARGLLRMLVWLVAVEFVGFVLWCPYIWTDPIRFSKAVAGNVGKPGAHFEFSVFFRNLSTSLGLVLMILGAAVVLAALTRSLRNGASRLPIVVSITGLCLIALPLALRSTSTYPRYFIPLVAPLLLLTAFAPSVRIPNQISILIIALAAAGVLLTLVRQQAQARHLNAGLEAALVHGSRLPDDETLIVPEDAISAYIIRLSASDYERMARRARNQLETSNGLREFLRRRGVGELGRTVLLNDFNEDEQANALHLTAASKAQNLPARAIWVYGLAQGSTDIVSERTSISDGGLDQAILRFEDCRHCAILLGEHDALPGPPVWGHSTGWRWYEHQ